MNNNTQSSESVDPEFLPGATQDAPNDELIDNVQRDPIEPIEQVYEGEEIEQVPEPEQEPEHEAPLPKAPSKEKVSIVDKIKDFSNEAKQSASEANNAANAAKSLLDEVRATTGKLKDASLALQRGAEALEGNNSLTAEEVATTSYKAVLLALSENKVEAGEPPLTTSKLLVATLMAGAIGGGLGGVIVYFLMTNL